MYTCRAIRNTNYVGFSDKGYNNYWPLNLIKDYMYGLFVLHFQNVSRIFNYSDFPPPPAGPHRSERGRVL